MSRQTRWSITVLFACSITIFSGCSERDLSTSTQSSVSDAEQTETAVARLITAENIAPYDSRSIQDEVFYFVLPDRFHNGDPSNDNGALAGGISSGGFDPSHAMSFHGGDIQGLEQKLPYLKDMGISAIWLTPILRNQATQGDITGYHGYWVLDFTEIDPHLGSNQDLKQFINAAHANNIKVFFDIITNHTADVIKFTECHGQDGSGWSESGSACPYISLAEMQQGKQYTTVLPKGSEQLKTPAWLNDPIHYHNQGDSTFEGENSLNGDFFGLDDLKTESPAVVQGMIDIYRDIITEFKPDGFRIDTVKHVNTEFWQAFAPALEQHANNLGIKNFFMFGEVYDFEPKKLAYFTTTAKLPSVLDFALQSSLVDVFAKQQATNTFSRLFAQDHYYQDANQLLTFTGNHDMGRYAWYLKQQEHLSQSQQVLAMELAHAFLFFARGIPVIYYGDEQGFVGDGGDKSARQDMMPSAVDAYNQLPLLANNATTADDNFDQASYFYRRFAEYASLYHQHRALRHGQLSVVYEQASPGLFAFHRKTEDQQLLVVFNSALVQKSLQPQINLDDYHLIYGPKLTKDQSNQSQLAAQSVAIFKRH